MFERLKLSQRPPMASSQYLDAVQRAADELRAATPWLLLPYKPSELWVASRRTVWMRLVVLVANCYRRPRRWWLGRLEMAREARFTKTGNRNME